MTEESSDSFFPLFHPGAYLRCLTQNVKKSSAFIFRTFSVKNLKCTGITAYCHMHFFPESFFQIFLACPDNRGQNLIFESSTIHQIPDRHKSRYPHTSAVCQHGKRFFIHVIGVFNAVNTGFNCSLHSKPSSCAICTISFTSAAESGVPVIFP